MPVRRLSSPTRKPVVLAAVHPNAGVQAAYRRKLEALIDAMHASIVRSITASYRRNTPVMAQDDSPAMGLRFDIRDLGRRWLERFNEAAPQVAKWFATSALERSDFALREVLRKAGWTVEFKMSAAANDVLQATIGGNISLIKSIAQKHLSDVEGLVMRSVQAGGDLGTLTKSLQGAYGITKRRAATIAQHQNRLANTTITRVRQTELGVTTARWLHSGGGRHPRESHVKASRDRAVYNVADGWYDPDEKRRIRPGELIGCRCISRSIVPGLE